MAEVYNYIGCKFWAEGGMVRIVRESDGEAESHSPPRFNEIIQAHIKLWKRLKRTDLKHAARMKRHIDDMVMCWREASEQGDPTDPNVRRELLRGRGKGTGGSSRVFTGASKLLLPGSTTTPSKLIIPGT